MSDRPAARPTMRVRGDVLAVISAGGALGSLGRWSLGEAFGHSAHQPFWGTLVANLTGAFLLGVLMVLVLDVWPPRRYVRPFLGVGVLGGYTTFSTFMLETRDLLASGEIATALVYLLGTLMAGLVAVWLGVVLARVAVAGVVRRRRHRGTRPSAGGLPPHPDSGAEPDPDDTTTRSPR